MFQATEKDLNNLIINAAFILLYKDLIRLFASYNEGMMNLVGELAMLLTNCLPRCSALNIFLLRNFREVLHNEAFSMQDSNRTLPRFS